METASYDPEFWRAMTPLLSSDQWLTLDRISQAHDVLFITHRWVRDTYDIHRITCDWLRRHGLTRPVVHFTQKKKSALIRKLGIELFVDDRHENCEDVTGERRRRADFVRNVKHVVIFRSAICFNLSCSYFA